MNYFTKRWILNVSKAFDKVVLLKQLDFVWHVGVTYASTFSYSDNIALVLP